MLEIENLSKRYGDLSAVRDLSFSVERGELFGFVGHNGAGKTTTMKIIAGLIRPSGGNVRIDGQSIFQNSVEIKRKIGYMPDFFGVYDNLRVSEYMEFYASLYGLAGESARRRIHELLSLVNLEGKEHTYVDTLSRGMKQRLCLARSLVHDPELLLLDEPASGLDPLARYEIKAILKELRSRNKTIMISSHILPELSDMCTTIGIMQKGQMILSGTMEEIEMQAVHARPLHIKVLNGQAKALERLSGDLRAEGIRTVENEIVLDYKASEKETAELLFALHEDGVLVESFYREKGNLETLFIELTREEEEQ